jgi:hypothetical protein
MARNRYLRKLQRRFLSILHKIELVVWLGTFVILFVFWRHGEVPWSEVVKSVLVGSLLLAGGLVFLLHLLRRRLSSGVVHSRSEWPPKDFSEELEECDGAYMFIGDSFKPHLDTFISSYRQDASGKRKVSLVLAPAEKLIDAELCRDHLEVIEALKDITVEFRAMQRPRSWWTHIFNVQDESNVFMILGLNSPDGKGPSTVLELEKIPKRHGLFEHFMSEARYVYSMSDIKDTEIWSNDLKRVISLRNNQER